MREKRTAPYWITIILLAAAAASCIFGASRGEMKTVYQKSSSICMECIGIG